MWIKPHKEGSRLILLESVLHDNFTSMTIRFANCHICLTAVRRSPHAAIDITTEYITGSFIVFNCYLFVIDITTANDIYLCYTTNYFGFFFFFGNLCLIQFCSLYCIFLSCPHLLTPGFVSLPWQRPRVDDNNYFSSIVINILIDL